jgi:hypothetical protein
MEFIREYCIIRIMFLISEGEIRIMAEVKFEIIRNFGVLSESAKGWTMELNLVSWNDREAKYDIREWSPEHDKMSKGVTMTGEQLKALRDILNGMDL